MLLGSVRTKAKPRRAYSAAKVAKALLSSAMAHRSHAKKNRLLATRCGVVERWLVQHDKTDDRLEIDLFEVFADTEHELGVDPGLIKDGVEAHLQVLMAEQIAVLGEGHTLVRREYPTAIGPVDILARDSIGRAVAIEIKRRGDIDGVEQLTRYLELLNRDPLLSPVVGVFAAQEIKPQARVLAEDRGIRCLVLDYDAMRGVDTGHTRLF